jgi:hypothetical protein
MELFRRFGIRAWWADHTGKEKTGVDPRALTDSRKEGGEGDVRIRGGPGSRTEPGSGPGAGGVEAEVHGGVHLSILWGRRVVILGGAHRGVGLGAAFGRSRRSVIGAASLSQVRGGIKFGRRRTKLWAPAEIVLWPEAR